MIFDQTSFGFDPEFVAHPVFNNDPTLSARFWTIADRLLCPVEWETDAGVTLGCDRIVGHRGHHVKVWSFE